MKHDKSNASNSLVYRLRVGMALVLGVVVLLGAGGFHFFVKQFYTSERHSSVDSLGDLLVRLIERPISQGDYAKVEGYLQSRSHPSYLRKIDAIDPSGNAIASYVNSSSQCSDTEERTFNILSNDYMAGSYGSGNIGQITMSLTNCDLAVKTRNIAITTVAAGGLIFFIFFLLTGRSISSALRPLTETVRRSTKQSSNIEFEKDLINASPKEIQPLMTQLQEQFNTAIKGRMAEEVFHDLISPLISVENYILSLQDKLGEEEFFSLRRKIRRPLDLLNTLRSRNLKLSGENAAKEVYLDILIEELLSEKQVQYMNDSMTIEYDRQRSDYGAFVAFDPSRLSRVISNVVDNSVEAIKTSGRNFRGQVTIQVKNEADFVVLSVKDNGCGIAEYDFEKIFDKDFSTKKTEKKSGIGLHSAKQFLTSAAGGIRVSHSSVDGSTIDILLPKSMPPIWFLKAITVPINTTVVIVDDERYIYDVLSQRFSRLGIEFEFISSKSDLKTWIDANGNNNALFLVDFHYHGQSYTGIDLITQFNLSDRSVLVTSKADNSEVLQLCKEAGVKLLPKTLAPYVPIQVQSMDFKQTAAPIYFLDDDKMNLIATEKFLSGLGLKVDIFNQVDEFLSHMKTAPKDARIFLDSKLEGAEITGEQIADQLASEGFENLFLSTGFNKERFSSGHRFKEVIEKAPVEQWRNRVREICCS